MVPMINAFKKSFNYQLDSLSQYLKESYHRKSPESSFAHYVFQQTKSQLPFDVASDLEIATLEPNRLTQAPALAAVGYGLACGRQFSLAFLESWANGLVRLSGRDPFPAHRTSFFYRPTELLGITLGVSFYYKNQPEQLQWLQKILVEGEQKLIHSDVSTFLLSAYAAHILSVSWKSKNLPLVNEMTVNELALAKWLCSAEPTFADTFRLIQVESSIDKALLEYCNESLIPKDDNARAALLYFALKKTINQIFQVILDEYEQFCQNPQKSVQWLLDISDPIHVVIQNLQSQLTRKDDTECNISTVYLLRQALSKLSSEIDLLEIEVFKIIKAYYNNPYGANKPGIVITTGNLNMTHNEDKSVINNTTIHAPNSSIGFVQSGSGTVSNFSQKIGQNIDEINTLIASLRKIAQEFPEAEREEVLMNLDDLEEDISKPEKQNPQKITLRLGRLLAITGTIAGLAAGVADFSNNVLELSDKLGIRSNLHHTPLIQQIPPSAPNQPSN